MQCPAVYAGHRGRKNMALGSVLSNALTALQTSQTALGVTSNNIANVNTPGFQRRVVHQEALHTNGTAGGVGVAEVRRIAATFLTREGLSATSSTAQYEAEFRFHDRLQVLFGNPDQNVSLPGRINAVFSAISDLTVDPSSDVRRSALLNQLEDFGSSVSRLAQNIQESRFDADQEIEGAVNAINNALETVFLLNPQISQSSISGQDVSGLQDQRDAALDELAKYIDFRTDLQPDGRTFVSTIDGVPLINDRLFQLQYEAAGLVTASTVFATITAHPVDPATGMITPQGTAIAPHINSGELRGLLNVRDQILPDLASEIGEFSASVADELNRVSNNSSAVPAPSTLVGSNTGLLATDAHNFSGRTTLAVTDTTGNLVSRIDIDFDANTLSVDGGGPVAFGGTGSVSDLISAVDSALGANGSAAFSNGVLSVNGTPGNGISFLEDSAAPSSRGGRSFSHFFGLNDVLRANSPTHFDTGLASTDSHGFGAGETVNILLRGPNGETAIDYTLTIAPGTVGSMLTQLNAAGTGMGGFVSFTLDANGKIEATPTAAFPGYGVQIVSDSTQRGTTGLSFGEVFGIGEEPQAEQARDLALVSTLAGNPAALAIAQLDITPATVAGDFVLSVGDNRGALVMEGLQDIPVSFGAAGGLAARNTTLENYATTILTEASTEAARAEAQRDASDRLKIELDERIASVEGVNLDEELANLILYQQSYNAAARMITAADELFDALLNAV